MSSLPSGLPVGFRFSPTEKELLEYYLRRKVAGMSIDCNIIPELGNGNLAPSDLSVLPFQADDSNQEYYFFGRKDNYGTGKRATRATGAGFWKASGRDKAIRNKRQQIGMRKTLVFYEGRPANGEKTDWIMHEFRLDDGRGMRAHEDGGWVVCRVFTKTKSSSEQQMEARLQEIVPMLSTTNSAAAAGGGEGMSSSYGRGNSFSAIQDMTLQGEALHHQHQGPVSLAATHNNSNYTQAIFPNEPYHNNSNYTDEIFPNEPYPTDYVF